MKPMPRETPKICCSSTVILTAVPNNGALQSVDGLSLISRPLGIGDHEPGTTASRLLFVEQPKEDSLGLQHGQFLPLEVEVYGTVRGSANWRETICQYILELGYVHVRVRALRPDTFATSRHLQNLFNDAEWLTSKETIVVSDDVLASVNERQKAMMRRTRKTFSFWKVLQGAV